ncbi:sulfurtransferase [Sphingomonas sp. RS2018]
MATDTVLMTPAHLAALPDARILDATWFLPEHDRDARAEHDAAHIPGAIFLDLASLNGADGNLATPDAFAQRMGALGVTEGDTIVLYDDSPLHTSARIWWALRTMGARDVRILDGGLGAWRADSRPIESGIATPASATFTPRYDGTGVRDLAAMTSTDAQIVDARSPARFAGAEPEPRAGVVPGHIPGSTNLHYARLFDADGRLKPDDALREELAAANVDIDRQIVATCGSGVTAANLVLALHRLGRDVPLYDGSWTEWGSHPTAPKETGA